HGFRRLPGGRPQPHGCHSSSDFPGQWLSPRPVRRKTQAEEGGMRRPRRRLSVSTFPFLAVLLCAMGSLILLLLVIDRPAKAGARAMGWQAAQKLAEAQGRFNRRQQDSARRADRMLVDLEALRVRTGQAHVQLSREEEKARMAREATECAGQDL